MTIDGREAVGCVGACIFCGGVFVVEGFHCRKGFVIFVGVFERAVENACFVRRLRRQGEGWRGIAWAWVFIVPAEGNRTLFAAGLL